jgi:C1A family cysteine protease
MNILQSVMNNPIAQSIGNNPVQGILNNINQLVNSIQPDINNPSKITSDPNVMTTLKNIYNLYQQLITQYNYIPTITVNNTNIKLNTLKSTSNTSVNNYIGAGAPQNTVDLRPQLLPIRNQLSVCSCVSFSTSCMREFEAKSNNYLSPAFIYHLRSNSPQDCMTIQNALDILSSSGVCYDNTYSYSNISSTGAIPQNAINEATKFRIQSYARINDVASLKNALQKYGPCPIAFPVYNHSDQMWIQNPGDTFIGGHCMLVVGYDANSFIIRNSWGTNWGNQGYTNFPFNQWGIQWEVWTCTSYPPPGSILPPITTSNSLSNTNLFNNLSTTTIIIGSVSIVVCILLMIIIIVGFHR